MDSRVTLHGFRRLFAKYTPGVERFLRFSADESLAVAQAETERAEISRAGRRFVGTLNPGAARNVSAIPTTGALYMLWNGEAFGSGLDYSLERVTGFVSSAAASESSFTILVAVTTQPIASPGATAATISTASGSTRGTKAIGYAGASVTIPAGSSWIAVGTIATSTNAALGFGRRWIDLAGGILISPGYAACFAFLDGASSSIHGLGVQWAEQDLDQE